MGARAVREIRMLRATGRGLETEPWRGLRHRQKAKAAGNSYSPLPVATAPALDPTGNLGIGSLPCCHPGWACSYPVLRWVWYFLPCLQNPER